MGGDGTVVGVAKTRYVQSVLIRRILADMVAGTLRDFELIHAAGIEGLEPVFKLL